MKKVILIVFFACIAAGCTKNAGSAQTDAQKPETLIRMAIESHLAHRVTLNLQAFDTNVKQVAIQGDHATAEVEFRVKGGPGAMQLTYALEKRDGAWSVIDSDAGGQQLLPSFPEPGADPRRE